MTLTAYGAVLLRALTNERRTAPVGLVLSVLLASALVSGCLFGYPQRALWVDNRSGMTVQFWTPYGWVKAEPGTVGGAWQHDTATSPQTVQVFGADCSPLASLTWDDKSDATILVTSEIRLVPGMPENLRQPAARLPDADHACQ